MTTPAPTQLPKPETPDTVEPYDPHTAADALTAFLNQQDTANFETLINHLHRARLHANIPRTRFTKHYAAAALAALGADETTVTRLAPNVGGAVRGYFD